MAKSQIVPRLLTRSVEFRASDTGENGDGRTLEGYAAVFGATTYIREYGIEFTEEIAPGAFKKTLRERKPIMQFNHGNDVRTGQVPIGVFRELREDEHGLYVEGRLFDNDLVEPIRQAIEGKAITGMSFKFNIIRDEWRDNADKRLSNAEIERLLFDPGTRGPLKRTIKEVALYEAGPVSSPAYEQTTVGVRSAFEGLTPDQRAALLRELSPPSDDVETTRDEPAPVETREEEVENMSVTTDEAVTTADNTDAAPAGTSERETNKEGHAPSVTTTTESEGAIMDTTLTVEERAARQGEIRARLNEIDAEFNGAELPVTVQGEWDSLTDEHEGHQRAIDAAVSRKERLSKLATKEGHRESGSDRGAPAFHKSADNIYDLTEIRNKARTPSDIGPLARDAALRIVERTRFIGNKERSQDQLDKLLNYTDDSKGSIAQRIIATGSPAYERAFGRLMATQRFEMLSSEDQRVIQNAHMRDQSLSIDSEGGYAVPYHLDPTVLLDNPGRVNPLRQIARSVSIVGKEWQAVTSEGVSVERVAESTRGSGNWNASPEANFDLVQPVARPTTVRAHTRLSIELDQDWSQVRAEVARAFADAKEEEEALAFTLGEDNGVTGPEGIAYRLSNEPGSLVAVDLSSAADVFELDNDMWPRYRPNARFVANKTTINTVRQYESVQSNGAIWQPSLQPGAPSQLIGYPIHELSTLPDNVLILGDFSRFVIVERVGMSIELIPHMFNAAGAPTGQRGIHMLYRNTSLVLTPSAFRMNAEAS